MSKVQVGLLQALKLTKSAIQIGNTETAIYFLDTLIEGLEKEDVKKSTTLESVQKHAEYIAQTAVEATQGPISTGRIILDRRSEMDDSVHLPNDGESASVDVLPGSDSGSNEKPNTP